MNPITIPNITIPIIGLPTIGIPSVGFPSASDGGLVWPKGLKESIKAIYDPAKQGMTNYDVIESYAEDFTTWKSFTERGSVQVTQKTIHIIEVKDIDRNIIEDHTEPYEDITVFVTGITDDLNLYWFKTGLGSLKLKNGINILKGKGLYNGFKVSKLGVVDISITQLPTSILKDLSGNGLDAYMYGFQGKLNSGVGIYQTDFTAWRTISASGTMERKPNSLHITNVNNIAKAFIHTTEKVNAFKVKIEGDFNGLTFRYIYDSINKGVLFINSPGIYNFPAIENANYNNGFYGSVFGGDCDITVTQIPDYPNQLCYSGKEYCISYNQPILTDYTVIADRTWFDNNGNRVFITKGNIWPNCAFTFEKINVALRSETFSYSQSTNIDDLIGKSGITYQTKQSYNGKVIGVGTSSDGDILLIGGQLKGEYIGCHGKIIISDRSFTEDEITWLKDNWKKI